MKKENDKKRRKSQLPIAVLVILLTAAFIFYLNDVKLASYFLFGIAFGAVLQRSRFCFTAAFRDPIMTKTASLTNALLLSVTVGTVGVAVLNLIWNSHGKRLTGIDAVYPLSLLTVIGGILFGIGMVVASGCASGTLMRMGEGFKLQWLSFFFFLLGAVLGSGVMGYVEPLFEKARISIFLPDHMGWLMATAIQLLLIAAVYLLIKRFVKRR